MPDNQPVNQAPKAPQPPAQKTPNLVSPNKQSKLGLLLVFSGIFLVLFVLFLVFLVVLLAQNGGNNPVLQALGVEPALLRQLLSTLISLVFGFLSLVSFIVMAVGLFRRLTSTKVELEKKKNSLIM
ncbi:MAG: hypothetical protein Q8P95_00660, partial [bacterium]|nr:hypothetical protein [bacterium]